MTGATTRTADEEDPSESMITSPLGHSLDLVGRIDHLKTLPLLGLVDAVAAAGGLALPPVEIVVALEDDSVLQRLNRQWRQKDKPTNVLSFPAFEGAELGETCQQFASLSSDYGPLHIGDLILSLDTAAREAADAQKPLDDHLCHLFVHGVLHLLGYDHIEDDDADKMEALEVAILSGFDIENPYLISETGEEKGKDTPHG